jgi:endonuclease/exonuclease/phosphatase family metal-dependent hydrolase
MTKKSFSILNLILLLCNCIAVVALLTAYLANYLNPKQYFPMALSGLFYPYILVSNIFFMLIWLFRKRKYCLISLLTILLGFSSAQRLCQFGGKDSPSDKTGLIKVLSYNVQILGLYDKNNTRKDDIIHFLEEEKPDITCLQEYYHDNNPKTALLATSQFTKALDVSYYFLYLPLARHNYQFGMAIFSRFPIIQKGTITFKDAKTNHAMFADIKVNNDTVRVYNIHFQSIHFGAEDYLFAQQATSNSDLSNDTWKKGSIRILKKIRNGFAKRSVQVDTIVNHIKTSPYKVIVCGDFNDTPWSYTYKQIRNLLEDSFVNSGKGFGYSMVINKLLSFRIDYIFHDESFKSYGFTTGNLKASDHYPIYTYIEITTP